MMMETHFNSLLVLVSVFVATFASYVAINLSQNVFQSKGRVQLLWLCAGSLTMGFGIWSMHFIGMLAFEMPGMDMAYDIPLMILSVLVAIGASFLGFAIVSRNVVTNAAILMGGIAMAVAIAGMHYIGMYSMRMSAIIEWNPVLVAASVFVALAASLGALFIIRRLKKTTEQTKEIYIASLIMGIAVSGMHYTGMKAATFIHAPELEISDKDLLVSSGLSMTVIAVTLAISAIALIGSFAQKVLEKRAKRARSLLGKSEERFRRLVEAVEEYAIFMLDPEGNVTTWNLGAQRLYGYSELEVLGQHLSMFYTEKDLNHHVSDSELKTAMRTGRFSGEAERKRKDGTTFFASIDIAPVYEEDGTISGFSKVIRDITKLREAEQLQKRINSELEARVQARTYELVIREHQLRSISNAIPVLVAEVNKKEKILFANNAFAQWFSKEVSLDGRFLSEVLPAEFYPVVKASMEKVLRGEVVNYERTSTSVTTGITSTMAVTYVPEFDIINQVTGFIIVASDISKYKEIQKELQSAKEAAEMANDTKSAFLANMSHEIRTPLGAVLGFSELLLTQDLSPSERVNSVEVIKRNGKLLSNIINDILDLSKVEAGKLEVEKINISFSEIMKELTSLLSLEAREKGLDFKVVSQGPLPGRFSTDPIRLRQILLNIVGNSIKFTQSGSVHITVKMVSQNGANPKIAFIVKDTGAGIAPEKIGRLFQPFSQADVSTTRRFGGTGLGLSLSKKLAQALGGDLELTQTEVGKGSTFTITIDPGANEHVLFEGKNHNKPELMFQNQDQDQLKNRKILLVDDSPDNQALIKIFLKTAGAEVDVANNGREGVEKALNGKYNLVLMDLQMPEMDGYEATRILRSKGFQRPIIALTAHAMSEERERTLRSGFDAHVTKPIDKGILLHTISGYSV